METFNEQNDCFSFTRRYLQGNCEARRTEIIRKWGIGFNDNNNLFCYSFSTAICNKWYIFKLSSCYFQITYLDIHLKNTRELVWVVEGNLCKTPLNRLVNLKVFDHHNNSYISLECNNLVKYLGVLISLACVSSEIRNLQCVFLRI